ncbi:MAG: alanine--tRNA ligase [Tenericutes bacterium GWC2_34_14]|nr:MAG: alanine--tRNA ligase [Tenericutes bacterium GWA2_35_7]OHE28471.1 MAG: alanine--tRNA ligase [Tenericutes bacterium GWC2_34_14]OHE33621.1 MAG: alanine--tRNA ligase [Tenericutes bacterium GWE2_34_108]OHE36906.1 MAG: alanine--tRNA ligase [Tenericutes bacterium GWF1_35_14]OHE38014.1 MAG: alanine--tRNA ligase [Tenericutes bacterium GWF2_35_184]OHE43469.1 MAG: alanine--tRNA ligase [Tenericutes bacterium RIFOXYA2_FULL_36_32]OHE43681.1 MAG: alanine--tRNA ligase [Tenericutes bacterium RIFOXYA12
MKYMSAAEIRQMWLDFFKSKMHKVEASASLVPQNDPTLLWINAGVAPLKKYFDGTEKPQNPRITNVQKCIRTNDIDNVGKTARHHTFFEMLGNFSIGDYFKHEAIAFGFELLTDPKWFGFPLDKLYMTYYPDDLDAKNRWIELGVDPSHLIPRTDNFWEIGSGPCGPDTEIYYDRGESYDKRGKELIEEDLENERYIEIWNIVFSQFNSKPGLARENYPELPSKNIDTGAGLERFACVIQQTETNFETDLFYPIIKHTEKLSGVTYTGQMAFKVIADHIKALTFAISDGAILSNEGRGYVLRRLLRRAVKYGRKLGLTKPFLFELVDNVVEVMGVFYQNLHETKDIVKKLVLKEEQKFLETINEGEKHLMDAIEKEGHLVSGETAFKLYDTYGFPIELTLEYAEEQGVSVDLDAFKNELEKQKERSRAARGETASMKAQEEAYLNFTEPSQFVGYDILQTEAKVIKVFPNGIVLDQTPFYATSGGQVADKGWINGLAVTDVSKLPHGQFIHQVEGEYEIGDEVLAVVDPKERLKTVRNHSAAHLFHQAIKDIFGKHANQQGSQVAPWSWRFDFNHYETESDDRILEVEKLVNHYIKETPLDVVIRKLPIEEARKLGAMALFGEKYGDIVRVVDMGWSKEFCGGTHVKNTKEIIDFAITSYESIGSGIYRMEGVTGFDLKNQVKHYLEPQEQEISLIVDKIKRLDEQLEIPHAPELLGSYQDIIHFRAYVSQLKELAKTYEKEVLRKNSESTLKRLDDFIQDPSNKKQVIVTEGLDQKVLKQLIDGLYDKIKAETLFLINVSEGKLTFLCKSELNNAADLVKHAANLSSGSGGGKGNFAQGGTQDVSKLDLIKKEIEQAL